MNKIYILLGANLGNPVHQLQKAQALLSEKLGQLLHASALYESEAWGVEDQPIFINQVLLLATEYSPQQCLAICQAIENELGRVRKEKWGARLIDIDILYYNSEIIQEPDLVIPHPYIQERKFTLMPLVEIAATYLHPKFQLRNEQLLLNCTDKLVVKKMNTMTFQIISLDILNQSMMGNSELIKQLIDMYIQQSPVDFETLREAIHTGDKVLIRERAHHIKPTMQYIGAQNLQDDFQKLETLAKEDAPLAEIEELLNQIQPSFELMMQELRSIA